MGSSSTSDELITYNFNLNNNNETNEGGFGLRYRGLGGHHDESLRVNPPSLLTERYSDEICCEASIHYVSDGDDKGTVPVFVTKQGNKVYIPPSIVDLLRDKPQELCCGEGDYDDEELGDEGRRVKAYDSIDFDDDSDFGDNEAVKIGINGDITEENGTRDDTDGDADDLGGVRVAKPRKLKRQASDSFDFFDSDMIYAAWEQFKYVGPRLVPFLKTLVLYFVLFIPDDRPSLWSMTVKCLPTLSLALFIVLHGIGFGEKYKFPRHIFMGLLFSCFGDAFLIWPGYFLHGVIAFGIAHCFYIRAFGLRPLVLKAGIAVFAITGSSLILILPALLVESFSMLLGVLTYSCLLNTMLWRAIARTQQESTYKADNSSLPASTTTDSSNWSNMCACIGALLFVISDTILALNQFYTRIPYHQALIMTTYYMGQFGIAMSVVARKELKSGDADEFPVIAHDKDDGDFGATQTIRQRKANADI